MSEAEEVNSKLCRTDDRTESSSSKLFLPLLLLLPSKPSLSSNTCDSDPERCGGCDGCVCRARAGALVIDDD